MVKALDLKPTLEMTETESPNDVESWGEWQQFESRSDPKSSSLKVWLFLVPLITVPVGHSLAFKQRQKNIPR